MVSGEESEMLQNGFVELPKIKYSVQNEKWLARNENNVFWQWFWATSQKCFKTAPWRLQKPNIRYRTKNGSRVMKISLSGNPKTKYSVQTEKWLARNENKAFWQWFWARSQKCFKTAFWRIQKLDAQKW